MSEKTPFFSIVIPTRNRPSLFEDALRSVIHQNFNDFEIVISDNSTNNETQNIIAKYNNQTKLKVYKPDVELNMLNHWEFASKKAKGKYVLILADRNVLVQGSLKKIFKIILKNQNIECFSFGIQSFCETNNSLKKRTFKKGNNIFDLSQLVSNFKQEIWSNTLYSYSLDNCFPKSINSIYKNEFIHRIRERYGSYFNFDGVVTPDYSSFFINSINTNNVYFIGDTILLRQGNLDSNGGKFFSGDLSYLDTIDNFKGFEIDFLINIPLVYNAICSDFICIYRHFEKNIIIDKDFMLSYFSNLLYEISLLEKSHFKNDNLLIFRHKILEYAEKYQISKREIEEKIDTIDSRINKRKDFITNIDIHLKDFLSVRFSEQSFINKIYKFKYKSILEAAGF
jgi:GT2 family glycosyltransferase